MSNRPPCHRCGSLTARGDVKCFKCGTFTTSYKRTPGYGFGGTNNDINPLQHNVTYNLNMFNPKILEWLIVDCGLIPTQIRDQRLGYVSDKNALFIPALEHDNELRFYQIRYFNEESKIKYATFGNTSQYFIAYYDHPTDNKVVVVEDHVSAIRIRKQYNVVCLSGTTFSHDVVRYLIKQYLQIVIWLDSDAPGQKAVSKGVRRLLKASDKSAVESAFICHRTTEHIIYIVDPTQYTLDPKKYIDDTIQSAIVNARKC